MRYKKEAYRQLCEQEPSISLFSQPWWLDAVTGPDGWGVALVEKGGQILATMPYLERRRAGFRLSTQPWLTLSLGPWLRPSTAKPPRRISQQKDLLQALIAQLPPFDHFQQKWHYSQTNWLPFRWSGFRQTTDYSYVIPDLSDPNAVWDGFQENIRKEIRKASNRFQLCVRDDRPLEDMLRLHHMSFARQGRLAPCPEHVVRAIDTACAQRGQRAFFIAEDSQSRQHATVYVVWDANSAYYLLGGGDPELRNSGAASLCMWEAIKHVSTATRSFDFCGSMAEPIEQFVRAFGGTQCPYFSVSKTPSKMLAGYLFLDSLRASSQRA
ncbi:MAG: GNAT family N-acetyltransferase [Alcaligenaceae bacterium]|nr:GNAT family N-acetyltransferase [Alcaligenaceae bacterium]